jgi:hypothetical protein
MPKTPATVLIATFGREEPVAGIPLEIDINKTKQVSIDLFLSVSNLSFTVIPFRVARTAHKHLWRV